MDNSRVAGNIREKLDFERSRRADRLARSARIRAAEHAVAIAVRITGIIKTRVRASAIEKARRELLAMFSFPRRTLSPTCAAAASFLFGLSFRGESIARIIKLAGDEQRPRGKRIAAGQAARFFGKNARCEERTSGLG